MTDLKDYFSIIIADHNFIQVSTSYSSAPQNAIAKTQYYEKYKNNITLF